jgi:flagellar hook assembly protein FlgD
LPKDSDVKVEIYNLLGQRVKLLLSGREKAGYKTLIWDGTNDAGSSVSSGVYFYKVEAGSYKDTKKMTLLK